MPAGRRLWFSVPAVTHTPREHPLLISSEREREGKRTFPASPPCFLSSAGSCDAVDFDDDDAAATAATAPLEERERSPPFAFALPHASQHPPPSWPAA